MLGVRDVYGSDITGFSRQGGPEPRIGESELDHPGAHHPLGRRRLLGDSPGASASFPVLRLGDRTVVGVGEEIAIRP